MKDGNIDVQAAVISHIGCVRGNNEDNFFIDGDMMYEDEVNLGAHINTKLQGPFHLFAVCDGMGGLECGEQASQITVRMLSTMMKDFTNLEIRDRIDTFARDANRSVHEDVVKKLGNDGKEGTTLALLYVNEGTAHIANVGDSRVYIERLNTLQQLSVDHSMVFRMMLSGEITREQMRKHPAGNRIEEYIGMPEEKVSRDYVNHVSCSLCKGDRFLICSDGLTDLLPDEMIHDGLSKGTPDEAAQTLINNALELGGKDNVTAIVVDILNEEYPAPTRSSLTSLAMKGTNTDTTTAITV